MNDGAEQRLTREEAQRHFAVAFNRLAWRLLGTRYRDDEETARMIHAAHASLIHWLEVGSPVNWQRGYWLLARVYCEVGNGDAAIIYARQSRSVHDAHLAEMSRFDTVYALEAEARALAVSGETEAAMQLLEQARSAAELVADEQDRKFILDDISGGNWGDLEAADGPV